ncbi:MAG: gamma-glutamyl-gamma-aminobutyrate hydrolase family protein [Deltaproteobacteria bacterium]|nr:gamma-glutamyl-gamma-aminobutyrate hydrolase family protein [Deltaproteobacteria bacterium]
MRRLFIKLSLLLSCQLLFVSTAFAAHQHLVIGCTIPCGQFITARVEHSAAQRGVSVEFVDLREAADRTDLRTALSSVDAVISPGGDDVDPRYYMDAVAPEDRERVAELDARFGQHTNESRSRDEHEFKLRKMYFGEERFRKLPFLGICYGMQMLAVSQGLPLVIDIHEVYGIQNRYGVFDHAWLDKDSLAASVLAAPGASGRESHHQAVDVRAYARIQPPSTYITGISNDGRIPEALEFESRPLALGVQFHPEGSSMELSDEVFGWVLDRTRQQSDLEKQQRRSQLERRRACERFLTGSSNL